MVSGGVGRLGESLDGGFPVCLNLLGSLPHLLVSLSLQLFGLLLLLGGENGSTVCWFWSVGFARRAIVRELRESFRTCSASRRHAR